jgi:hypothetical protein
MTPVAILKKIRSRAERALEARHRSRLKENSLARAIDLVVQASAPVVCSLRDCRRDLRSPVEHALGYLERAIEAIPGPERLSPENWDRDPLLKGLFVSPDELRSLLQRDPSLKAFFARQPADRAFALLTATRREHTIFATAQEGNIVQRDVPQTAVEFHDHRIIDPSTASADTRQALKERALNALVTQVLERLLKLRSLKDELKEQQRILSIKLKILQTRPHGLDALRSGEAASKAEPAAAPQVLAEIDRRIQDLAAESDSPEEYLRQLTAVLAAPEQVLTVTPVLMHLNWMGVKQGNAAAAGDRGFELAEVEFQDRLKRVAVFVEIARRNCRRP